MSMCKSRGYNGQQAESSCAKGIIFQQWLYTQQAWSMFKCYRESAIGQWRDPAFCTSNFYRNTFELALYMLLGEYFTQLGFYFSLCFELAVLLQTNTCTELYLSKYGSYFQFKQFGSKWNNS